MLVFLVFDEHHRTNLDFSKAICCSSTCRWNGPPPALTIDPPSKLETPVCILSYGCLYPPSKLHLAMQWTVTQRLWIRPYTKSIVEEKFDRAGPLIHLKEAGLLVRSNQVSQVWLMTRPASPGDRWLVKVCRFFNLRLLLSNDQMLIGLYWFGLAWCVLMHLDMYSTGSPLRNACQHISFQKQSG